MRGCYPKLRDVGSEAMRARLTVFVCALIATLLIGIATPGSANVITRSDGNDTKGPLDLSGAKVSHVAGGSVFQINTLAPFTNAQANGKNGLFEVGIDSNADRNPNYFIDVFFAAGRFRGVLFKPSGSVISYNLKAARVSPKAVKVTLPHSQIIQKGSYDFLIFSAYFAAPCTNKNPCVDAIPNRYPLIRHDYTPPTMTWGAVPTYSSDVTATVTFPVPFSLKDDVYGSGMKSWLLQRKAVGTSAWVFVKAGIALHPAVQVNGSEGTSYDLRVVSFDRQNNKRTSPTRRVNIPFDDRHPSLLTYTLQTPNDSVAGAFLGTTTSIATTGTLLFTMPFDVTDICVIGGPTTGPASSMSVIAPTPIGGPIVEDGLTPARDRTCVGASVASGNLVTMTSSSPEPFVLDGIILVP
jgi:hypothetical protein